MLPAFVIVLAAALPVVTVLWIRSRNRQTEIRLRAEQLASEIAQRTAAIQLSEAERDRLREQTAKLQSEVAALQARLESERYNAQEKLALLSSAREELANQFKSLASDILEEKSRRFTQQNQENLGQLIAPLKEKFGEFQQKVENLEKDGVAGRSELKVQLEQLRSLNERLSEDASSLVTALRGSSKTQGEWGEVVLERILESCGLRRDHEYRVQETMTREDGRRARLDIIIDLPEGRHLVLDSKVSLTDYSEYCTAADEPTRDAALARHLASVRKHIRELSQRDYPSLYRLNSLDFVVMFVPVEPAFMLALARDGKLWQEAWDKSILLVSPSTLLFVLRTVAHLWRQEQQKRNVQEIVRRGGELYDKLAAFAKDLTEVGKKLGDARDAYDEAYKKLAEGRGNVIRQAEILRSLGVRPTKQIPQGMRELAMEQELFEESDEPQELQALSNGSRNRAAVEAANGHRPD
ncbi:MAG: DNA recombination protein RmuC [Acidobacteriaceae bacterium]|nr:DNA recombination protein RmuC [Acidobacteriaceae bacterium]